MDSWISREQAQSLLRMQLNRNDLYIGPQDELSEDGKPFKMFMYRYGSINAPVLNENHTVNVCKVYRELDNEMQFHETRQYEAVQNEIPDGDTNRPFPILEQSFPCHRPSNTRGITTYRSPCSVPLSLLLRDNDPVVFTSIFCLQLMIQIIEAVMVMHEYDFTHNNLKPDDILLAFEIEANDGQNVLNLNMNDLGRPYRNHPVLSNYNFHVIIQNLENTTLFQKSISHNSNRQKHIPFRFVKECEYNPPTDIVFGPPTRVRNGRRIPHGRKDDLISVLYIVVYLNSSSHPLCGLPWMNEFGNGPLDNDAETLLSIRKWDLTDVDIVRRCNPDIRELLRSLYVDIAHETTFSQKPEYYCSNKPGIIIQIENRLQLLQN